MSPNPDQLPILQHALMRTWDYWEEQNAPETPINRKHYESIGSMTDALSRHADQIYNELPNDRSRYIAEILFKQLTDKTTENREVRRPTQLSEICDVADADIDEVVMVIDEFRGTRRSFLIPPTGIALTRTSVIDISHESFMRNWKRLRNWIEEETQSANIYRRLAETEALHQKHQAGYLRGPELVIASNWYNDQKPNKSWAQRYIPNYKQALDFLRNSIQTDTLEKAEQEKSRRQRIFHLRCYILGLSFLLVLAVGMTGYALKQTKEAKIQKRRADDLALRLSTSAIDTQNFISEFATEDKSAKDLKQALEARNSLSESEAHEVIENYLLSKRKIFAPPYDTALAMNLTTGEQYKKIHATQNWLKDNNAYYQYKNININTLNIIASNENNVIVETDLTEDLILYVNEEVNGSRSGLKNTRARYNLQKEDGSWKISSTDVL